LTGSPTLCAGVVANLLLAAPQLAGSAQRGIMRVLHSLASVPNAVSTCFPRQQAAHSMMQVLDGTPSSPTTTGTAADGAAQRSLVSGGSNNGTASGADPGVTSRALEVLLAVCRADEAALREIKDYPGKWSRCMCSHESAVNPRLRRVCLPVQLCLNVLVALSRHQPAACAETWQLHVRLYRDILTSPADQVLLGEMCVQAGSSRWSASCSMEHAAQQASSCSCSPSLLSTSSIRRIS
jgi:hypothetical protein